MTELGHDKIKIVLMGPGGVGKSALTLQMIQSRFVEGHDPTIEDSYQKYINVDQLPCRLDVLDTAGQEEFISMQKSYLQQGEGFILVYSVTDRDSFEAIDNFYENARNAKGDNLILVLVGNKCDLSDEMREVSYPDLEAKAQKWDIAKGLYFEASAKTRYNLEEIFYQAIRRVRTHGVVPCTCKDRCKCRDRCMDCQEARNKHKPHVTDHTFKERSKGFCTIL